ncbi:transposase [Actinomadura sp. 3N407]|uniref:transposase n=1 Tax=Actinomadura sp. 3N407 TaxID=3457423 RepID=UPI003FCE6CAF
MTFDDLAAGRGNTVHRPRIVQALDIGRPPEHDLRTIMDAILYVDRTGIPWRYLPHDYPPWQTVYGYFRTWRDEELFTRLPGLPHRLVRVHQGRPAESSATVIDAQSVKTSTQSSGRRPEHRRRQEDRRPQAQHRGRHPRTASGGAGHRRLRPRLDRRHHPDRPAGHRPSRDPLDLGGPEGQRLLARHR